MWSEDTPGDTMPMPGDGERALQTSRRPQHWTKTSDGIERIRQANLKHGCYTAAVKAARRHCWQLMKEARETLKEVRSRLGPVVKPRK